MGSELRYNQGFGNHFSTEAVPNTLPIGRNSPQRVAYGLYAEQLSGSSFCAPRSENLRSWLYRTMPALSHGGFKQVQAAPHWKSDFDEIPASPEQFRWDPLPDAPANTEFLNGVHTYAGNGGPKERRGASAHLYAFHKSPVDSFFYDADGDLLFVPQQATLLFHTELGRMRVAPGEIAVIPRGIRFRVESEGGEARGYICENFGQPFQLPGLGPIGANGLANPRDFMAPVAAFESKKGSYKIIGKFQGNFWMAETAYHPLNVVAWHGNYYPYKYDLSRFNTIGTVSFDHPDPSIFTVLTSPSDLAGTANVDFVIFPPRWMVGEDTFRPPYYHRNVMSEFMGLVKGAYDAKPEGFVAGGASLHNSMSGHGPDADAFRLASEAKLAPQYIGDTMAIMFETSLPFSLTPFAMEAKHRQQGYLDCWKNLPAASL